MMIINERRYLYVNLSPEDVMKCTKKTKVDIDPLQGSVLKVKVPFRYNRVMCKVNGLRTIQELKKGDIIDIRIEYTGTWKTTEGDIGSTWNLVEIFT
jgi:hypothetical protein